MIKFLIDLHILDAKSAVLDVFEKSVCMDVARTQKRTTYGYPYYKGSAIYGYPYYKGSAIFLIVFLSFTSEKSFIPYKASAAVQTLKVFPVRPKVLSSWGITLLEKLRAADES